MGATMSERWSVEVRRPEPNETFSGSLMTTPPLFGFNWVAAVADRQRTAAYVPAMTRKRAINKARRWIKRKERAEASAEVVEL